MPPVPVAVFEQSAPAGPVMTQVFEPASQLVSAGQPSSSAVGSQAAPTSANMVHLPFSVTAPVMWLSLSPTQAKPSTHEPGCEQSVAGASRSLHAEVAPLRSQ